MNVLISQNMILDHQYIFVINQQSDLCLYDKTKDFDAKKSLYRVSNSPLEYSVFLHKIVPRCLKSVSERSEYISYPKTVNFCRATQATCDQALSWSKIASSSSHILFNWNTLLLSWCKWFLLLLWNFWNKCRTVQTQEDPSPHSLLILAAVLETLWTSLNWCKKK